MYRIVDMRDATSGRRAFAIFDTIRDRFFEVDGEQCFDSMGDFLECVKRDDGFENLPDVDRVIGLLPDWAKAETEEDAPDPDLERFKPGDQ